MTDLPIVETYWVEEDRLLAGEYPGSFEPETARRKIDKFLEAGVNTFIDLTEPNELVPYEPVLVERARIYNITVSYQRASIRDYSVPSVETMTSILNIIDKALNDQRCVYVHCWGGVGRTGIVVGCYLVRHGLTNEQAAAEVNRLYHTRPNSLALPRSPESDEQLEFILNWWEDRGALYKNNLKFCEG